jgi:parvulin-like peptidyl-prolyl isomerase
MVNSLKISREEIIQYLKFSCQIPAVLEAIATRQIITNATKSVKITVQADELQQSADASRVAYGLLRAGDTWNWLQAHHLSLDEFEEIAYTNVLSKKLAQHLFADQIEPLFFAHQLDHAGAVIYEIILEDEDLALELFYAIREGEICFQDAARQYIEDIELRRSGGYRGILSRLDLTRNLCIHICSESTTDSETNRNSKGCSPHLGRRNYGSTGSNMLMAS